MDAEKIEQFRKEVDSMSVEELDRHYLRQTKLWKPVNDDRMEIGIKVSLLSLAMFRKRLTAQWPEVPVERVVVVEISPSDHPEKLEEYIQHVEKVMEVKRIEVDESRGSLRVVGHKKKIQEGAQ